MHVFILCSDVKPCRDYRAYRRRFGCSYASRLQHLLPVKSEAYMMTTQNKRTKIRAKHHVVVTVLLRLSPLHLLCPRVCGA